MKAPVSPLRVVLLANYRPDRQQSMLRYAAMLARHLPGLGIPVEVVHPPACFGRLAAPESRLFKWLAYLDKYLLFPPLLAASSLGRRLRGAPAVVHICDHSNAFYAYCLAGLPCVATCHDVGAIRGALGELDDCPATGLGRLLQRLIVRGLRRTGWIACVSEATRRDLARLVTGDSSRVRVIPNGLNRDLGRPPEATRGALAGAFPELLERPYLLHVGSGLARKNREGVLRVFAAFRKEWPGRLVFAGEPLSPEMLRLRDALGLGPDEVRGIEDASDAQLEALYAHAFALLFPSRFEGFGWPVVEAQASGCPVLTTTASALPEVAGDGACLRDPADEAGFVADLRSLRDPAFRAALVERGSRNAERFTAGEMASRFSGLYREILCAS